MSKTVGEIPGSEAERAILVAADIRNGRRLWNAEDSLDELAQLAGTAGIVVEGRVIQRRLQEDPQTYVGKGKLEELRRELGLGQEAG